MHCIRPDGSYPWNPKIEVVSSVFEGVGFWLLENDIKYGDMLVKGLHKCFRANSSARLGVAANVRARCCT